MLFIWVPVGTRRWRESLLCSMRWNRTRTARIKLHRDNVRHETLGQLHQFWVWVLILLILHARLTDPKHRCHTTIYVSPYYYCVLILLCVSSNYYMCAHTTHTKASLTDPTACCPHTTVYVSSYHYICVLNAESLCGYFGFSGATILLICRRPQNLAASYYDTCVLILLYI
jgi:hypothetical protein